MLSLPPSEQVPEPTARTLTPELTALGTSILALTAETGLPSSGRDVRNYSHAETIAQFDPDAFERVMQATLFAHQLPWAAYYAQLWKDQGNRIAIVRTAWEMWRPGLATLSAEFRGPEDPTPAIRAIVGMTNFPAVAANGAEFIFGSSFNDQYRGGLTLALDAREPGLSAPDEWTVAVAGFIGSLDNVLKEVGRPDVQVETGRVDSPATSY